MSWLSNALNPGGAFKAGQQRLQEGQQRAEGFQRPFMQAGVDQIGNLQGATQNLLDPKNFMNQLLEGYQESPYAKQLQDVAMERGQQASSQMGLGGSSPALQAITQQAGNISQQDRQNYLKNLMDMYHEGTGLSSSIFGTGANMGGQMGQQALGVGQRMGELEQQRQQAGSSMLGQGLGLAGDLGLGWLTGGFGTGGYGRGQFAPNRGY